MRGLDKLERKIIKKLQRYKIDGVGKISATNHKQRSPKGKILASAEQEKWCRYFALGMYWHGREEVNHKALIYFRRCLQLNPENEPANCYVGMILLCFLYLRNIKGFGWDHKRVYRIYKELALNMRIKSKKRLLREKPEKLIVPKQ